MQEKFYMLFLILCTIFAQAIGTPEENIKKSSNLLIRKKRVFNRTPNGNTPVSLVEIPYIVVIEEDDEYVCGGSILASNIIVSAAHCFDQLNSTYTVQSGSSNIHYGRFHNITMKLEHPNFNWHSLDNDLVLLLINPHIDFRHSLNRPILLFDGHLPPNTYGTFSGWGCYAIRRRKMVRPDELRSIIVPTISTEDCANFYHDIAVITDKDLCTHDIIEGKCAGDGDSGSPFAVNGYLAGVMAWSRENQIEKQPDIFVNVAHPFYRTWIIANMRLINGEF